MHTHVCDSLRENLAHPTKIEFLFKGNEDDKNVINRAMGKQNLGLQYMYICWFYFHSDIISSLVPRLPPPTTPPTTTNTTNTKNIHKKYNQKNKQKQTKKTHNTYIQKNK